MSASTFNEASPTIRAFWRNFRDRYLAYIGSDYRLDLIDLVPMQPCNMASRNRLYQLNYGITENIDLPVLKDNDTLAPPDDSPVYDPMFGFGYPDQWYWIPLLFNPLTRSKYNVPKSYWTGCARRRRNL
jgi:hypothetical protein